MTFKYNRRAFLQNWAVLAAGAPAVPALAKARDSDDFGGPGNLESGALPGDLERGFLAPPDWAKPWCYWWWLNGYVTREGIVKDLDEMKRQGINGVLVFNASGGPTPQTTVFMSQEWRDLFRFAVEEAGKRGIEVSLNLCSGWDAGGPWITAEEAPQSLVFTKLRLRGPQAFAGVLSEPKHDDPYYRDIFVLAYRLKTTTAATGGPPSIANVGEYNAYYYTGPTKAESAKKLLSVCRSDSVVDLSKGMEPDGRLTWEVPEGDWLLVRFGHTVKMPVSQARIKECGPKDRGYEIDPLRADVMDKQFAATAGKVLQDVKPWVGKTKTLQYFHIDSWEIGKPNWTPAMRDEFRRHRGYDLLPYMAALAEETVDSHEITARFHEDFNTTLGDLTVENYYGRLAELSHQQGVGTHPESEGPGKPCIDSLRSLGTGDIMMAEFWSRTTEPDGDIPLRSPADLRWFDGIKGAASAGHIYGRPIVQAEAFTELFSVDWSHYPFALKDIGDLAFCAGLNRNVLCFYVHQPDLEAIPGYEWPRCGLKVDRNVTWWPKIQAWLGYLARCQFLFQRGRFVADVCYFYGEEVPNYVRAKECMIPPLPSGFDCDSINAEALLNRINVKDGRLFLPEGISYRLLVMPYHPWSMPPRGYSSENAYPGPGNGLPVGISAKVLRKIKELAESGATVLGPKPVRAPGLSGYPQCDEEVLKLADELWGETESTPAGERMVGKGRVIWGKRIEDIFEKEGLLPDFRFRSDQWGTNLQYIHYTLDGTEIYFISNQNLRSEKAECQFRVSGLQPELWDPVTGEIRGLPEFRSNQGQTFVPMEFAPRQSFFVVFRKAAKRALTAGKKNFPRIKAVREINGPWEVSFDPRWGGPARVTFDRLEDWTTRSEEGIRYYSGTAAYRKVFDVPAGTRGKRLFLDLGVVNYLAAVRLNGKDLGVIWTAPWRVDITQAVKQRGNSLEIEVVNLWPNRLIGDAKLPPEKRYTKTNVPPDPDWQLFPSGLLGPVTLRMEA